MGWVVLFFAAWFLAVLLVPIKEWKRLWPAGLFGLTTVYATDSTFVGLGAFSYEHANPGLSGLPLFYLLSIAGFSFVLAYFYPNKAWKQVAFVMLMAFAFILVEMVMLRLDYFHYLSWSSARSYLLNIGGMVLVLWLAQKTRAVGRGPRFDKHDLR